MAIAHIRLKLLSDKPSAANCAERETEEVTSMSIRLPKKATLADLIAAVTNEVSPLTRGIALGILGIVNLKKKPSVQYGCVSRRRLSRE